MKKWYFKNGQLVQLDLTEPFDNIIAVQSKEELINSEWENVDKDYIAALVIKNKSKVNHPEYYFVCNQSPYINNAELNWEISFGYVSVGEAIVDMLEDGWRVYYKGKEIKL